METMSRRQFVTALAGSAAGIFGMGQIALGADQPAATPAPAAGPHQVKPLKFAANALRGISEEVVNLHHDRHYAGYVKKRNDIDVQLVALGPGTQGFDARVFAGVKRDEAFNTSGMVLHEVYFDNLGGDGKPGAGAAEQAILGRFGSIEKWVAEMTAVGAQATGWALLCHDPSDARLHVQLVDGHQLGAVWGAVPVPALDVIEHAYYKDFGPDRAKYMTAFFDNLHWGRVNERYAAAVR